MRRARAASLAGGALVALLAVPAAAGPAQTGAGPTLATVGSERLTQAYLDVALAEGMGAGQDQAAVVRHLVDMKLLALAGRERHPELAAGVAAEAGVRLRGVLAGRYERDEVVGKVAPVTPKDVDAEYTPYKVYDLDRYYFEVRDEAKIFLERHTGDPEAYKLAFSKVSFTGVLPRELPEGLRAALPTLKAKSWFGPMDWGKSAALVYWVRAISPPAEDVVRKDREVLRGRIEARRLKARTGEVNGSLAARYALVENLAPLEELSGGKTLKDLDPSHVLATWKGGTISIGTLQEAATRQVSRSGHAIYTASRVKILYSELLRDTMYELAARALGWHEEPAVAAAGAYFSDQAWSVALAGEIRRQAGKVTPKELEEHWKGHRKEYPKSVEESRPALERAVVAAKSARLVAEYRAAAEKGHPVHIP